MIITIGSMDVKPVNKNCEADPVKYCFLISNALLAGGYYWVPSRSIVFTSAKNDQDN